MTNLNISSLCICAAAAFGLCGCGNGPIDKISDSTTQTNLNSFAAGDFVARSALRVRSVPQEGDENPANDFEIPEGTSVSVIETKVDPQHGTIVRLGIDADEDSALPSDLWVSLDHALLAGLVQEEVGVEEEEEVEEDVGAFENVKKAVKKSKKKMTYCYRYVKRYLMSTGKVKVYLPGNSAYMAAKTLPKHGFRNSGHTPANAKNGEVCVYSGGPKGHGHIEVKRDGKWWYGYGFSANSMKNRKFIACFIK
jgi:hypothetical protein